MGGRGGSRASLQSEASTNLFGGGARALPKCMDGPPMPTTHATNSGDIARRLLAGDIASNKFIAYKKSQEKK